MYPSMQRYLKRLTREGYYRFGKGAIPVLKNGAKKRNVAFNLTAELLTYWWKNTPDQCYYCELTIKEFKSLRKQIIEYRGNNWEISKYQKFFISDNHRKMNWLTIDRKRTRQGYHVANMVKACWICNSVKSNFYTEQQMSVIGKLLIQQLQEDLMKEKLLNFAQSMKRFAKQLQKSF